MSSKGFTLIELLVVLAVLALILTLAMPDLRQALPGLEAKATAQEVADALRRARGRAIRENREAFLVVDVDRRAYGIDGLSVQQIDGDTTVALVTAASELGDESIGRIRFFPDGTSTGGRITLQQAHRSFEISVDWLTGRIRVAE